MNKIMNKILFVCVSTIIFAAAVAAQQTDVDAFDKYADAARQTWGVPGMALTVVKDGKVLISKGYGVKEIGKADAVDSQTLFGCMSTTKAMTAVAMAILMDEGKINPSDKVIKYLPDFRLGDPYITNELTVRDLFTHNTGFASTDFLWAVTPELPPDEAVRRLQYAKPAYSLRGGFVYQNTMYLVAGKVIEKASGMSWDQFMTTRVFAPLGMRATFPTLASSLVYKNRTAPHFKIKGKVEVIPEMQIDSIAPAGAAWSTADDIAKWVTFLLTGKTPEGKELLKPATLNMLFRPQVILPPNFYPSFAAIKPHFSTYGYGWFQIDYRGEKIDMHTGSIAGRTAIVGLLRDKGVGVYIFGNIDHVELRHALMMKALDVFGFGDNSRDWSTELKQLYDKIAADTEKEIEAMRAPKLQNSKPSHPLADYAGQYSDPFYGTVEVKFENGKLIAYVAKDLTAELVPRHTDTFNVVWSKAWMGEDVMSFQLNAVTGDVESLMLLGDTPMKRLATKR